jgi:hypothetical protein
MGGFRARDADRERYVEVIEAAYVDGQLGDQDRELRVSRALTAETLDELDALTRDLQNQPAPVVVHQTPAPTVLAPTSAAPPKPVPSSRGPEGLPKLLGFVAAGIFVLVVVGMASSAQDEMDPFSDNGPYVATWEPDSVNDADDMLSASDVRGFVRRYEAKFHTGEAYEVTFFSDRVSAHVPAPGSGPQFDVWTWDGEWRRDGKARNVDGAMHLVDLRTLDARALFENAEVAKQELGVSDAYLQRVAVRPTPDGQGLVSIHVRNGLAHSASLETTPQGSRVRAVPHEG